MIRLRQLIFIALSLTAILLFTFHSARAQAQGLVKMYIVNPLTGDNTFNVSDCSVGSAFTLEFYVGNVIDMVTWQIRLKYNRTLINYAETWFPDDNVFKQAIDNGAIPMKGIAVNVDNATDEGDLLIVMTCTYPPSSPIKYPVTVESKGLLCKVNFTIAAHPAFTQIAFVTEQQDPSSLHVTPPYYLAGYRTSVQTLNDMYLATGDPAFVGDIAFVPETPTLLLLTMITATIIIFLIGRQTKTQSHNR